MKYRVAVGTADGVRVTEHFGRGESFFIYEIDRDTDETVLVEKRLFGERGSECGDHDAEGAAAKIEALGDCQIVLVAKIGYRSEKQLTLGGIVPLQYEGELEDALARVRTVYKRRRFD
jgi:nitrogenase molybdenum-iron protein NifN